MVFLADTKKQAVAQYLFGAEQPLFFLAILMGQPHFIKFYEALRKSP
jgi:hypothetical protein